MARQRKIRAPALTNQFLTLELYTDIIVRDDKEVLTLVDKHRPYCVFCESNYNLHKNKSGRCSGRCHTNLRRTAGYYE